jgi:tetratricopeptide (TPR) repeat protein
MRVGATARNASLIVAAALSGCAGRSPFDAQTGFQPPANMPSPSSMTPSAPSGQSVLPPPVGQTSGPTLTPPTVTSGSETILPSTEGTQLPSAWNQYKPSGYLASTGAALASSWKQTQNSITSALTIQSKVTPASDPVRLDSKPVNADVVSADLHYHAGRVFEANNSFEAAASHYRDALTRTPNDPKLVLSYSRVMDRAGNFQEAEAGYRRAIALAPNDGKGFNDLAMCLNRQGKCDWAINNLQQAIQLEPSNALYRNNLALVLVDAGRPDEALSQLVNVHGEAAAHYNVGYLLLERHHTAEAEQHFARALDLNPQLQQAQQMLEQVRIAAGVGESKPDFAKRLPATDAFPVQR